MKSKVLATCLLVTAVESIQLVTHPNGAVVPSEGAAILEARAKHLAAINAAKIDHLNNYLKPLGQAVADNLVVSPSSLVFHPNGAVVPSEDAAILAARAHNLAAQAAHINLLSKNGLNVSFEYTASKSIVGSDLGYAVDVLILVIEIIDEIAKRLSSTFGARAANEVAALQAVRANLVTTKTTL